MVALHVGGACASRKLELTTEDLAAAAEEHQVPDVGALVDGRAGAVVRLAALAELAGPSSRARFVHVASEDGAFTANLPLEQAMGALVVYRLGGDALPASAGGPFRLLLTDSEDCSVSVKFLGRVEFVSEPGSHTARCAGE